MEEGIKIAPKGKIWVCLACGKTSKNKYGDEFSQSGWDASCFLNSVLCDEDKLVFGKDGRVKRIKE